MATDDKAQTAPPENPHFSTKTADWVTRTTAILAVLAALASGRWGASNLNAILQQGKVNDGWSYFQAKSIKQHEAEDMSLLAQAFRADVAPNTSGELAAFAARLRVQAERLTKEKQEEFDTNKALEKRRDWYVEGSLWFEVAFALLQVGVVLCTIAAAAKKKFLWKVAMVLGLCGLTSIANGFGRWFPMPSILTEKMAGFIKSDVEKHAATKAAPGPDQPPADSK